MKYISTLLFIILSTPALSTAESDAYLGDVLGEYSGNYLISVAMLNALKDSSCGHALPGDILSVNDAFYLDVLLTIPPKDRSGVINMYNKIKKDFVVGGNQIVSAFIEQAGKDFSGSQVCDSVAFAVVEGHQVTTESWKEAKRLYGWSNTKNRATE